MALPQPPPANSLVCKSAHDSQISSKIPIHWIDIILESSVSLRAPDQDLLNGVRIPAIKKRNNEGSQLRRQGAIYLPATARHEQKIAAQLRRKRELLQQMDVWTPRIEAHAAELPSVEEESCPRKAARSGGAQDGTAQDDLPSEPLGALESTAVSVSSGLCSSQLAQPSESVCIHEPVEEANEADIQEPSLPQESRKSSSQEAGAQKEDLASTSLPAQSPAVRGSPSLCDTHAEWNTHINSMIASRRKGVESPRSQSPGLSDGGRSNSDQ